MPAERTRWRRGAVAACFVLAAGLMWTPVPAQASTSTCGTIFGNVTWNASGSPFVICGNGVTVADGATLTIDASTGPVEIQGGFLHVAGSLITKNTSVASGVTFDRPADVLSAVDIAGNSAFISMSWARLESWSVQGYAFRAATVSLDHDTFNGAGAGVGLQGDIGFGASTLTVTNSTVSAAGLWVQCGADGVGTANNNTVTNPSGGGIDVNCGQVTAKNNVVVNSGQPSVNVTRPAMSVTGAYTLGPTGSVSANRGSGNAVDAIALGGTISGDVAWLTPTNSSVLHALGYGVYSGVTFQGPSTLSVPANSIMKGDGGVGLRNVHLDATAAGTVFTSLEDNSVGPPTCTATAGCQSPVGMNFTADASSKLDFGAVTLRNSMVQTQGAITVNGSTATDGRGFWLDNTPSATFNACTIRRMVAGAIVGSATVASVTGCTIDGVVSGVGPTVNGGAMGVSLGGRTIQPYSGKITITGNTVRNTQDVGIRVVGSTQLSVTNNTVTGTYPSPFNSSPPAFEIDGSPVVLGAGGNLFGNQVANNSLDQIDFGNDTETGNFVWLSPTNSAALHAPGYVGELTVNSGGSVTVPRSASVDATLTLLGGTFDASAGLAHITTAGIDVHSPSVGPPGKLLIYDAVVTGGGLAANGAIADVERTTVTDGRSLTSLTGATISVVGSSGNTLSNVTVTHAPGVAIALDTATTTVSATRVANNSGVGISVLDGTASISCTTIVNNGGGINVSSRSFNSVLPVTVHDTNLHGNDGSSSTPDLSVSAGATNAQHVYWGQPGGPRPHQVQTAAPGSVDVSQPLSQPAPCAPADPPRVNQIVTSPQALGGGVTAQPAIAMRNGQPQLLVRGLDGAVWINSGGGWTSLGGYTTDGPAASAATFSNGSDFAVFVRGGDGALWMRDSRLGLAWNPWQRLTGATLSGPAVTFDGHTLHLFVRGLDNQLWHRTYSYPVGWTEWEALGGYLTDAPAVASSRPGNVEVAVRGADGAVWTRSLDDGLWSGWTRVGGYTLGPPTVAVRPGHEIDVFVRGGDGHAWTNVYSEGAWRGWQQLAVIGLAPAAVETVALPEPTIRLAFVPPTQQLLTTDLK